MEPEASAEIARLHYVSDSTDGIRRSGPPSKFRFTDPQGRTVRDPNTLKRIRRLAIPPAWTDVWICSDPHGHLQAVGRDARRRKQYRYHANWTDVRDSTKYHRMIAFGKTLPKIRARVRRDLKQPDLGRNKVLATIVKLLEVTSIRVGNEEYSKQNNSFGLTTLRNRHVQIAGPAMDFYFRGKSGVQHHVGLQDRRLAAIVKRCRELPGYELFQYVDETGVRHSVGSADVNGYLHEIAGDEFTAKDFRTWNGTVLAATILAGLGEGRSKRQVRKNVLLAMQAVAEKLGNTVAVCRKCYVHPAVVAAYEDGRLGMEAGRRIRGLTLEEAAVLGVEKKPGLTAA